MCVDNAGLLHVIIDTCYCQSALPTKTLKNRLKIDFQRFLVTLNTTNLYQNVLK